MKTLALLAVLLGAASAGKVLVLVDSLGTRETHSQFFKSLQDAGHKLTFKSADDASLSLVKFGEFIFDHLLVFAPSVEEFGGSLKPKSISEFVDAGGNVVIVGGEGIGEGVRELANEVGFEFDEDRTALIDHLHYDTALDDGKHTTLVAEPKAQLLKAPKVFAQPASIGPILFRGVGLVTERGNPLTLELLSGTTSSYSANPDAAIEEYPHAVGKAAVLVGALQARNNARVLLVGSLELFSDRFFSAAVSSASGAKAGRSGNAAFVEDLMDWTLGAKSVLRVASVTHHLKGQKTPPEAYTIEDEVVFTINIEELKDGKWQGYKADDVQMEFVRIDPFVRTTMKSNNGKFSTTFKLPDVYGVYKFVVDYKRLGQASLFSSTQVSVRPLQHTAYERFIRSAYPYYASAASMMGGLWLFSCVFLHYKDPDAAKKPQ